MTELVLREWRGANGLAAERDAWLELLAASGADGLCNHPDWALEHARAFAGDASTFGFTLEDAGGEPVALAPLRREPARGPLALRRARLAQAGTFDSDYLDVLVRPGREPDAVRALLDALARARGVEAVVLDCVPSSSPVLRALAEELRRRRLPSRVRPEPCCAAALPATFDAYLAGLKSRMRTKVRSAIRRAEEQGATLDWCEDPSALDADLERLFELHQARWTAAGEPGAFAGEPRRAFYRALAPRLLAERRLGFAKLVLDGRTVATQIGAFAGATYYQLQEGYDPDLADLRPGIALRGLAIRALVERGTTSYDFMAGITRGKTDWGAAPRPCTTIAFALPGLRARVAYGLRALLDRRRAEP